MARSFRNVLPRQRTYYASRSALWLLSTVPFWAAIPVRKPELPRGTQQVIAAFQIVRLAPCAALPPL